MKFSQCFRQRKHNIHIVSMTKLSEAFSFSLWWHTYHIELVITPSKTFTLWLDSFHFAWILTFRDILRDLPPNFFTNQVFLRQITSQFLDVHLGVGKVLCHWKWIWIEKWFMNRDVFSWSIIMIASSIYCGNENNSKQRKLVLTRCLDWFLID